MPYIGNDLATQFQAFATQTITGDGSTGYTLDRAVANGKELLVYINNVKQEEGSGKSYTASGTTITFSEAVASGDSCYLVYMGSAQQTVVPPDASIVSGMIANSELVVTNDLKVTGNVTFNDDSADKDFRVESNSNANMLVIDGGNDIASIGRAVNSSSTLAIQNKDDINNNAIDVYNDNGNRTFSIQSNTSGDAQFKAFKNDGTQGFTLIGDGSVTNPLQPMFSADGSSSYVSYSDGDVLAFNNERFDIGGNFDTSTYTFTAPVTGKYFVSAYAITNNTFTGGVIIQHRNSSGTVLDNPRGYQVNGRYSHVSLLISCTATDTLRVTTQNAEAYYLGSGYGRFSGVLVG